MDYKTDVTRNWQLAHFRGIHFSKPRKMSLFSYAYDSTKWSVLYAVKDLINTHSLINCEKRNSQKKYAKGCCNQSLALFSR